MPLIVDSGIGIVGSVWCKATGSIEERYGNPALKPMRDHKRSV